MTENSRGDGQVSVATIPKMQAFIDSIPGQNPIHELLLKSFYLSTLSNQLACISLVRNTLVRLLNLKTDTRKSLRVLITLNLHLLQNLYLACLDQNSIVFDLDFKLPNALRMDAPYTPEFTAENRYGLFLLYLGQPYKDEILYRTLIDLGLYCYTNHSSPKFNDENIKLLFKMAESNPMYFISNIAALNFKQLSTIKAMKSFQKLKMYLEEMRRLNSPLICLDVIDVSLESVHNNIFNCVYVNESYLELGFRIYQGLFSDCIKLDYHIQLSNILKVFDDFLFNGKFQLHKRYYFIEIYASMLSKCDYDLMKLHLNNWLINALKLSPFESLSSRTILKLPHVNFDLLNENILPLLNCLVTKCHAQLEDIVSSIYILLLYPPNINLDKYPKILKNFEKYINGLIVNQRYIDFESLKLSKMFSILGMVQTNFSNYQKVDQSNPLCSTVSTKNHKISRSCIPFVLPYQLAFLLFKFKAKKKDENQYHNLIEIIQMDSTGDLEDQVVECLLFYQKLNLKWFDKDVFDSIIETLGAYDIPDNEVNPVASPDNFANNITEKQFDTVDGDTNDESHILPDIQAHSQSDPTTMTIPLPVIYPDCSYKVALKYTNVLANNTRSILDESNLILLDIFRFEADDKIKQNLIKIFHNDSASITDRFVNSLVNKLGQYKLLGEIVLKEDQLIERIKLTDIKKFDLIKFCTKEPIDAINFLCLKIFSRVFSDGGYKLKVSKDINYYYKSIMMIFYSFDHSKVDKLNFWNVLSASSVDTAGKISKALIQSIMQVWQHLGEKKCSFKRVNGQNIIIDNNLLRPKPSPKNKPKSKSGNSKAIIKNQSLDIDGKTWSFKVTVYPNGKKIKDNEVDPDLELKNKLFDSERKLWFLKQRSIGMESSIIGIDPNGLSISNDYYQRIFAFDLFKGAFEGEKSFGLLICSLFDFDNQVDFTITPIEKISDILKEIGYDRVTSKPLNALLLIEFIVIFIKRGIRTQFWSDELNRMKRSNNKTIKLAAQEAIPAESSKRSSKPKKKKNVKKQTVKDKDADSEEKTET